MSNKQDIIKSYLDEYPNLKTMTLAKKIYGENKLLWNNIETVRSAIRKLRGTSGKKELKKLNTDKYLSKEKIIEKYNLPPSIERKYEPYRIIGNYGLIFGDLHIPFHNNDAISRMFDYTINKNILFLQKF